jgi:4a-hydroxytetrahydrobiopterin dehydratase
MFPQPPSPSPWTAQQVPVEIVSAQNPDAQRLLPDFLSPSINTTKMQIAVHSLATEIVTTAMASDEDLTRVTLIPILRAALPMYAAAQTLFPTSGCVLVRGSRTKGTKDVKIEWLGRLPFPPEPDDGQIVLLDTVIATGGTILKVCDELWAMSNGKERWITVMACYASPEALAAIAHHPMVKGIFVGAMAETVDADGYLIPYTGGDIGDKLYGKPSS